ncbi:MAG: hypothetical protein L0Y44_13620 [Phycisphaerales bacterium]|nr:hypothetical protein [Phycisphaerales bacterium]MCI0631683.1 hypothetical protein [Phycisphaerales bacterium]MCI0677019.1 hypothetical protein [Phycisphaerales bacterium]
MERPCAIVTAVILVGCAGRYIEPSPSLDHPANPAAAEAVPPVRSQTLDLAAAEPVTPAKAPSDMEHARHGHAGHESAKPTATPSDSAILYVCPMHPEVTSDKPDARCPKCGMKLVKKSDPERQ